MSCVLDGKTAYELLKGTKPTLMHLPKWEMHVWIHDDLDSKLDMRRAW